MLLKAPSVEGKACGSLIPPSSSPTPPLAHNSSLKMQGFNRQGRPGNQMVLTHTCEDAEPC